MRVLFRIRYCSVIYLHCSLVPTAGVLFVLLKFIIDKQCIMIGLVKIFRHIKYNRVYGCNNSSELKVCQYLKLNDLLNAHSSYFYSSWNDS